MRLIAAILIPLIAHADNYLWSGAGHVSADGSTTNSQVGIVVKSCRRTPRGVYVSFWSDMSAPYVVGVHHMDTAEFAVPRYPIHRVLTAGSPAFVPGNFVDTPVFACVLSEPSIPTNQYYKLIEYASTNYYTLSTNTTVELVESGDDYTEVTNHVEATNWWSATDYSQIVGTNDFGLASMTPQQFDLYRTNRHFHVGVVDEPNWRYWSGFHADPDGALWIRQGGEKVKVGCTCPGHLPWCSEYVMMPVPFVSMSAQDGVRLDQTDNGIRFWQSDTNAVPNRIYPKGL